TDSSGYNFSKNSEGGESKKGEIGAYPAWIYSNAKHKSPKVVLKLDFQNALNEVRGDIMLRDSPEVVLADLDVVQKMAAAVGLTLNLSKLEMAVVGARSVNKEQSVIKLFKKRTSGTTTFLPADIFLKTTTIIAEGQEFWETSCHAEEVPAGSVCCIQSIWEAPVIQHTWRNAPFPQLRTYMSEETFRTSVAIRLGTDVCQPHRCPCNAAVSAKGLHVLACKLSNNNDMQALQTAGVPCIKKPPGCSRFDGKRPDGQTLVPCRRGLCLIWDVSCSDTFAPSHLSGNSKTAGYAAATGEAEKKKNMPNR
ncbi:hypothetical protein ILUMI_07978, partial [Ignelater luminosus]